MKKFLISFLGGASPGVVEALERECAHLRGSRDGWEKEAKSFARQTDTLKAELMGLDARSKRVVKVIAADIGDVEPQDEKKRKDYVAAASNFYLEVLEPKLLQMTAQVREEEDTIFLNVPPGLSRAEYDYVLKGTSNAFRSLMDWGEQMKAEHAANLNSEQPNE